MALTVTLDSRFPNLLKGENLGIATGTIQFDSSYPTGGEALTDLSKYFKDLYCVITDVKGGISTGYDRSADKLLAYWVDTTTDGAALAQVDDTTDLSAVTVSFIAVGR